MVRFILYSILVYLSFCATDGYAQFVKNGSLWYFGFNVGIDFKTDPPTFLPDGQVQNFFRRSCTMSDEAGNLLFYTDGMNVWDRQHQIMPNGTSLTLGLNFHTTPSVIVPHPGDPQLYYIFIANSWNGTSLSGLHYAIVDIAANSGKGQVIQKNIDLLNPSTILLSVVNHADDKSYWVMGHEWRTNKFYAYHVTETGIAPPVISAVGSTYSFWGSDLEPDQMCFSPDGTMLAVATGGNIELFDFNSATGVLTNLKSISVNWDSFYGVAFSPNSQLLYGSGGNNSLYQIDVSIRNANALAASQVGKLPRNALTDLQLAYNGRIYGGRGGGDCCRPLIVINNPNVKGLGCSFDQNGLTIPNDAVYGLPMSIQSYYREPTAIQAASICEGSTADIVVSSLGYADSVLWSYGDGSTEMVRMPIGSQTKHPYKKAGSYDITLTKYIGNISRTIQQIIEVKPMPVAFLGTDTTFCEGNTLMLSAGNESDFTWSTGQRSQEIEVRTSGKYWLKVKNGQCHNADTITVKVLKYPLLSLPEEIVNCKDDDEVLTGPTDPAFTYLWSTGETSSEITVTRSGQYFVRVSNEMCATEAATSIHFEKIEDFRMLPATYTVSAVEESVLLTAEGNNIDAYQWHFGDQQEEVTALSEVLHYYATSGTYQGNVTATNSWGCSAEATYTVTIPLFEFIPNVFTPNGDDKNEIFTVIYNGDVSNYLLKIFDRYGHLIFQSSNPGEPWHATDHPSAVYYYEVLLGNNRRKGWVQVLR